MANRSTKEWQAILLQHETSGLSVVDFCKLHEINKKYFNDRKRYWLKQPSRQSTSSFIKVNRARSDSAMMSLQLGEAKLVLSANTEPDWLAQLLKALSV